MPFNNAKFIRPLLNFLALFILAFKLLISHCILLEQIKNPKICYKHITFLILSDEKLKPKEIRLNKIVRTKF